MRATAWFVRGSLKAAPVTTLRRPTVWRPARPVSLTPPVMGMGPSRDIPIRREKNNSKGGGPNMPGAPISKMPEFSRKKSRFSGKKRLNRVKLTC